MSHTNCIFRRDTYTADATTVCDVCRKTGTAGNIWWYQGRTLTVCKAHDIAKTVAPDPLNAKAVRICDNSCAGSIKCIWPLPGSTDASSVISTATAG